MDTHFSLHFGEAGIFAPERAMVEIGQSRSYPRPERRGLRLVSFQILRWGHNQNPSDFLAEIRPKMPKVAGDEVCCPRVHRGKQYRPIFFGQ
jgi:hypothetical protein